MLRIALAQVNVTVGDLTGNAEIIVEWTRRAAARGARVVVFPEMALTGYPVEDLALRASFVEASIATLRDVAERLNVEGLGGGAGGGGDLGRARRDHQRQAPPAELRRLRRVPVLRARRHAARVPSSGRGRRGGR